MEKINIWEVEGMEFPAGRRTRVLIGENGVVRNKAFCQGYVVIYKDGGIPEHAHEAVEAYTILKGKGVICIDGEEQEVEEGDCIFIPSGRTHALCNTEDSELHIMFVYAPGTIAEHWEQEKRTVVHI